MNTKKAGNLSNEDKLMFVDFADWVNTILKEKRPEKFVYEDTVFQSFIQDNNISLRCANRIPKQINQKNTIIYKDNKRSKVKSLANHIRNAFTHTKMKRKDDSYTMYDEYYKKIEGKKKIHITTMRGIIDVDLMPDFLQAIKDNYRIREEDKAKRKAKATAVAGS